MKNTLRVLFIFGLLLVAFQPSQAMGQFFFTENEGIGKPVKAFTLQTVGGAKMSLADFRKQDKVVVFFWATWCPHCRKELGNLTLKKEELAQKGIKIALVDVGEDEATVKQYLQKNKVDFTVFLDQETAVAESYNVVGVPTFYLIDKQGIVRDVQYSLPPNYDEILSEPTQEKPQSPNPKPQINGKPRSLFWLFLILFIVCSLVLWICRYAPFGRNFYRWISRKI